jgi:hypothetical protein
VRSLPCRLGSRLVTRGPARPFQSIKLAEVCVRTTIDGGKYRNLLKHFDFSVQPNAPVEDPELEMWVTRIHGR